MIKKSLRKLVELLTHLSIYSFFLFLNYILKEPLLRIGITPFLCNCLRFCIGKRATYNLNKGGDPYLQNTINKNIGLCYMAAFIETFVAHFAFVFAK